ncbi:reticulocyte-binding protein 2-like [Mizuhopecten yessoensis]|uniref:reticulocyte-binding protein 2-like n=1 Tax=Mizuhopecten yessoensis TaxID=6573 RepID=UPI000B45B14A|nr:reticulocyte-binding protein 2-like [Mizuhopecten yessoensis]
MDYFGNLILTPGDVRIDNSEHPMPSWPFLLIEEVINLTDTVQVGSSANQFFLELNVGQFLCLAQTATNFEIYGLTVLSNHTWHDILTCWMSHFSGKLYKVNALRALHNRRLKRFKELQKRYNVRGDEKVKTVLLEYLASPIFPKQKHGVTPVTSESSESCTSVSDHVPLSQTQIMENKSVPCTPVFKNRTPSRSRTLSSTPVMRHPVFLRENGVPNLVKENRSLKLDSNRKEIKLQDVMDEKNLLDKTLKIRDVEIKKLRTVVNLDLNAENQKLKERNSTLFARTKRLKDLERKSNFQDRKMEKMKLEISRLVGLVTDNVDVGEVKENMDLKQMSDSVKVTNQVHGLKRIMKNLKKRIQRREKSVSNLKMELSKSRDDFQTDQYSTELYYEGIVDTMKNQHNLSVKKLSEELNQLKELETQKNGKYKAEVRLMYYDLLCKGVSANTIQSVVKTVLQHTTEFDLDTLQLPSRSTAQRMVSEAGELANIRAAYEIAKENRSLCHMSDGTTKHLIHWGSHVVKLKPLGANESKTFTLTVSPVASGKADD